MTEICDPQLSELLELKMELVMLVSFLSIFFRTASVPPGAERARWPTWLRDLVREVPTTGLVLYFPVFLDDPLT